MKRMPPHRLAAILTLGCALVPTALGLARHGQDDASPTTILLSRARTLEQRGRLDLAKQDWAQVLVADPNDAEALAGLVRAARAEGRVGDAAIYLARLRAAHPQDPEIARLEQSTAGRDNAAELAAAERLAHAGDPRGAMVLYRRIYGSAPPAGDPALAYFQTEAQTADGRPHAIAGLRALVDRFPSDARYQVALGRVLVGNPRTVAEGRTILERFPQDAQAVAALAISKASPAKGTDVAPAPAVASAAAPASKAGLSVPSARDEARATAPAAPRPTPAGSATASSAAHGTPSSQSLAQTTASSSAPAAARSPLPESRTAALPTAAGVDRSRHLTYAVEEQAAYAALNNHRSTEAEQRFRDILAKNPHDARALAGLGYLNVTTGNAKAAVSFFEQAQENGDRSLALTRAMVTAQFDLALQQAAAARTHGDLPHAEQQYRAALRERPSDPEALEGMGETLLLQQRPAEAMPVFARLTQVRPLDPAAWRGLVTAQTRAGQSAAALTTDAQVPPAAHAPLQQDPSYGQMIAQAKRGDRTQVARVDTPPAPPTATGTRSTTAPAEHASATAQPVPATQQRAPAPSQTAASSNSNRPSLPVVPRPAPTGSAVPPPTPATRAILAPPSANGQAAHAPSPARSPRNLPPPSTERAAVSPVEKTVPPARPGASPRPPSAPAVAKGPAQPEAAPAFALDSTGTQRLQQANFALLHGQNTEAAALFRDLLARSPEQPDAWRGLVLSLHNGGQEQEAASALQRIPGQARTLLDHDASFQAAAGSVYLGASQPSEALRAFAHAQDVFSQQHLPPPLDLVLQTSRLLAARGDDDNLYRELMYLGQRADLTDRQRTEVQMIWTRWAVRRARVLAADGDGRRAVTVLNAAAEAFAGNIAVLRAVAEGYAGVGRPREAVVLYKTQDLTAAPAPVLEAAVAAASAAHDYKTAEAWARLGLERFPQDPGMLTTFAELEQARGREKRALGLSQQAKAVAPAQDPGQVLAAELKQAQAGAGWAEHRAAPGQLSVLLAPNDAAVLGTGAVTRRPYLPTVPEGSASTTDRGLLGTAPVLAGYDEPSR